MTRTRTDPIRTALDLTAGLSLPAGFRFRLATTDDHAAIAALRNECRRAEGETARHEPEEIESDWTEPGRDPERNCLLVERVDGEVVAFAGVYDHGAHRIYDCEAGEVLPVARGRGIEDALLAWAERRVEGLIPNAPEGTEVWLGTTVVDPGSEHARAALGRAGYDVVRTFLRMERELPENPEWPRWPVGLRVRELRRDDEEDARAFWSAMRDSFADHWGVLPVDPDESFARFLHALERPAFDASLFWAVEDGREVAAICFCWKTWLGRKDASDLSTLGVRKPWRRRGIARAFLHHAFHELRRRGWRHIGLGVDSENGSGAVALYEQEGFRVTRRFLTHKKVLRPGASESGGVS